MFFLFRTLVSWHETGTAQTEPWPASVRSWKQPKGLAWRSEEAAWLIDQSLHRTGTSSDQSTWGDLERSAIAETSNVVGCEFLNAIAASVREISQTEVALMPDPPHVDQQLAGGWMDAAIIEVESSNAEREKAWLAMGTFQVADHAIHTRFAMV